MRLRLRGAVLPGALIALALALGGCYDFHVEGPEDPDPINPPRLVSVTVEYRQPNGCLNAAEHCNDAVVFFGSWMPAIGVPLQKDPDGLVWRGRIDSVPVNFPPRDEPYTVRIFDPHLFFSATRGITANHLTVGQQKLVRFREAGTEKESALVYIDENGFGHNPF